MGFADVERSLAGFADKARAGKITLDDMAGRLMASFTFVISTTIFTQAYYQGGTFTISNAGVYKSLFGTPIINPPQVCTLFFIFNNIVFLFILNYDEFL